jgi:hypothetical protein
MQETVLQLSLWGLEADFIFGVETKVLPSAAFGHIDEGELIRRGSVIRVSTTAVLFNNNTVTQTE